MFAECIKPAREKGTERGSFGCSKGSCGGHAHVDAVAYGLFVPKLKLNVVVVRQLLVAALLCSTLLLLVVPHCIAMERGTGVYVVYIHLSTYTHSLELRFIFLLRTSPRLDSKLRSIITPLSMSYGLHVIPLFAEKM